MKARFRRSHTLTDTLAERRIGADVRKGALLAGGHAAPDGSVPPEIELRAVHHKLVVVDYVPDAPVAHEEPGCLGPEVADVDIQFRQAGCPLHVGPQAELKALDPLAPRREVSLGAGGQDFDLDGVGGRANAGDGLGRGRPGGRLDHERKQDRVLARRKSLGRRLAR